MATVLLAEDDVRTRIGLTRALEARGHEVQRVTHLRLAARAAQLEDVSLVLLDLEHAERCEEFVRQIRERGKQTPVIAILDSLAGWRTRRLRRLDVQVLRKPLAVRVLLDEVGRVH